MNKLKFGTMYKPHESKSSELGEKIYEWKYINDDGEVETKRRNVYQMIQSGRRSSCSWKELVKEGGFEGDDDGIYLDVSELGDDPNALNDYIASVVKKLQRDMEKQQAGYKASEDSPPMPEAKEEIGQDLSKNKNKGEQE